VGDTLDALLDHLIRQFSFCPMADSSSVITGLNTGKRKQFNHLLHTKVAGAPLRSASCNLSDGGNSLATPTIGDAKCEPYLG